MHRLVAGCVTLARQHRGPYDPRVVAEGGADYL
jgi:hypothetical protein